MIKKTKPDLLYPEESYAIIGACYNVYNEMGPGLLESVYQECLRREFIYQKIPFEEKKKLTLSYRGQMLDKKYEADFICYNKILLEIKASSDLTDNYRKQTIHYLKITDHKLALLVNFGHYPDLEYERYAHTLRKPSGKGRPVLKR